MRQLAIRLAIVVAAFLLAGVGFFVALGFGVVGVFFLLERLIGPVWGAFATAMIAILISLLIIALGLFITRKPARRRDRADGLNPSYLAAAAGDLVGQRFAKFTGSHRTGSIFTSFVAGFAVGASPRLRDFLFDLFRL